jgi:prepilin-type N-terminal cleavage/methylation domain-containing protein
MKATKGFTLIELMIVLVVIAILTAVALPAYTNYVTRGKLAEAVSALSDGRVKMEQFFQDNRTYVGGPTPAATTNFTYATSNLTATTYTITATGIGSVSAFSYTVDQDNTKTSTTPWGNSASCWVINTGGGC